MFETGVWNHNIGFIRQFEYNIALSINILRLQRIGYRLFTLQLFGHTDVAQFHSCVYSNISYVLFFCIFFYIITFKINTFVFVKSCIAP